MVTGSFLMNSSNSLKTGSNRLKQAIGSSFWWLENYLILRAFKGLDLHIKSTFYEEQKHLWQQNLDNLIMWPSNIDTLL